MNRSILPVMLLFLFLLAFVGLTACGSNSAHAAQQHTPVPNEMQRKAMGLNELIAQLRAAGATVVPGTGVNQLFMDVAGHILTVNGEQIQVFDLTPAL